MSEHLWHIFTYKHAFRLMENVAYLVFTGLPDLQLESLA